MQEDISEKKYPTLLLIALTVTACLIPAILNAFGFDFSSKDASLLLENIVNKQQHSKAHENISISSGIFHHTLLEWSAVIIALTTVILSFAYFYTSNENETSITAPIIGMALFFSGITDAFHTLSSINMIDGVVHNENLMPFTWVISRTFNACILFISVLFALSLDNKNNNETIKKEPLSTIFLVCILFATTAYVFNHLSSANLNLPQVLYPKENIPRPFDIIPLGMFILITPLFLWLHIKQRNCLTLCLLLSIIPSIVLEMHMAFRSTALYDNDFNIAHFLKVISYMIPLLGIVVLHVDTFKKLQESKNKIKIAMNELAYVNEELDQFAYAASHDLQEPLRMVSSFTSLLEKEYSDKIDDTGKEYISYATSASKRMQQLIIDLLAFSRLGSEALADEKIDCDHIIDIVIENLAEPIKSSKAKIISDNLPTIYGNKVNIMRLFQNLIGNAIKYRQSDITSEIKISYTENDEEYIFHIEDNGIGFNPEQSTRIFKAFKRLSNKNQGSGIGLAMCKRIVHAHKGKIWAESDKKEGSTFNFTIPKIEQS